MAIVRGNPKNIAIHHSAVNPPAMNMAELKQRAAAHNNFHRANSQAWNNTTPGEYGYKWIRYHYMIAQDGSVLQTQHEKYALYANGDGVGSTSFNITAVNIMVEGNYEIAKPTEAMMLALVKLIRQIEARYKINPMVRGHKELSSTGTACPGKNIGTSKSGWLQQVIVNVNDKNYPAPADWRTEAKKLKEKTTYIAIKNTALFEIDTGKRIAEFEKGTKIDVDYEYKTYLITAWSYERKVKNGFKKSDIEPYVTTTPKPPEDPCGAEKDKILQLEQTNKDLNENIQLLEEDAMQLINVIKELDVRLEKKKASLKTSNKKITTLEEELELLRPLPDKVQNLKNEIKKKDDQIAGLKKQCNKVFENMTIGEIISAIVTKIKSVLSGEGRG